jgi:hypothetical protein
MNDKQTGASMKTTHKLILAACLAASLAAALSGCASTTLEQQIALKEVGSWDFQVKNASGATEYIRIYDSPGKVGYFKYEYGQKHPCNQGFQKAIKSTAPGWIAFTTDANEKSFACNSRLRYIFRTNDEGVPYDGWLQKVADHERKDFPDFESTVKRWDAALLGKKSNAGYTLVK